MFDKLESNEHGLDPMQKGCRNFLYVAFAVILSPLACLGITWLYDRYFAHPNIESTSGGSVIPTSIVTIIALVMIFGAIAIFRWISKKLFYEDQD